MTFVVTQGFLDHFGLESDRDLPGVAELRAAGLLDNRPAPGATLATGAEEAGEEPAGELF
jgi:segregation and condensation protein B